MQSNEKTTDQVGNQRRALIAYGVRVLLQATNAGFVRFDQPGEDRLARSAGLAEAVHQVPGRIPGDLNITMQLHARHALQVGRDQKRGLPHSFGTGESWTCA